MKESESFNSAAIADSIVFDVEFCGETLNAIADNKIIGLDADGNVQWTKDFENKTLHRYSVEDSGYKVCVFDSNNVSEINVISARGATSQALNRRLSRITYAYPTDICSTTTTAHLYSRRSRARIRKNTTARAIYTSCSYSMQTICLLFTIQALNLYTYDL